MIYCPTCHTANRDDSRFCNRCSTNLQGIAPTAETPPIQPAIESAEGVDAPEWVRQLCAVEPASETTEAFAAAISAADSIEAARISTAEVSELAPGEIPDWLKNLAPAAVVATRQPGWNRSHVAVEELPARLRPGAAQAAGLAPGEIPPWPVSVRPGGLAALDDDVLETSGLLSGIRGALPVESVLALPHKSVAALSAPSSVPELGFAELASPQPRPLGEEERPSPQKKRRWSWRNLLPWLILSAAAIAYLPLPWMDGVRGVNISGHQPASNFYQTINQVNGLHPNSLVLVAFDYSAGARDELDPQAKATLLQLFGNQQRIVAVSFVPSGGQLAQDALSSRNPANTGIGYPYRYGETHVNVGYVSGGEAAMKSLAQNFVPLAFTDFRDHDSAGNIPLAKEWKSWDDVDLLIVFSDDGAQLKRWIEQVVTQPNKPSKVLLVGASAAALPTVLPYYETPIKGYLSGVRGAAEYEGFLAQPATASARLDGMSYVVIVLVMVMTASLLATIFVRTPKAPA